MIPTCTRAAEGVKRGGVGLELDVWVLELLVALYDELHEGCTLDLRVVDVGEELLDGLAGLWEHSVRGPAAEKGEDVVPVPEVVYRLQRPLPEILVRVPSEQRDCAWVVDKLTDGPPQWHFLPSALHVLNELEHRIAKGGAAGAPLLQGLVGHEQGRVGPRVDRLELLVDLEPGQGVVEEVHVVEVSHGPHGELLAVAFEEALDERRVAEEDGAVAREVRGEDVPQAAHLGLAKGQQVPSQARPAGESTTPTSRARAPARPS
eukprot:CAMPEP_0206218668 /NCGR_PEP_ID=MMETSP0047_2-20121206/3918_1 /ASSEMBLY_ACC=CAM_ASM_000192 /TAXON_ID=195065 /ORGANISM="Chroomonas mesostigmatica_cf, Strain CCMP1168" /LENGTH=261 /DNA_ID=CAMNT_0053641179 /DNA_START=686 /DNA_END=1471 /DNA_ORIENTATION=-